MSIPGALADGSLVTVPPTWRPAQPLSLPSPLDGATLSTGTGDAVPLDIRAVGEGVHAIEGTSAGAQSLRLDLPCGALDAFAGGGAQFVSMNLRGRVLDGWLTDAASGQTYFHAPVLYSSAGWALVVDTVLRYSIDCAAASASVVSVTVPAPSLRAFLIVGTPRHCLSVVTEMTGRAPLPPPWAFGVWHNVRSGPAAVMEQASRLRAERIPASALWIDDHYCAEHNDGDGFPGNYRLARYGSVPEMRALVDSVHGMGFKALSYLNCMVYRDTPWFADAVRRGLVVRDASGAPLLIPFFNPLHARSGIVDFEEDAAAILDFSNPLTVAAWQDNVRALLTGVGWDGWMEDFGEQLPASAVLHDGSSGADAHNRYALLYHGATASVRAAAKPDAVVFARSGYLGSQALLPAYWGGDQLCEWSGEFGIGSVLPAGLSAGLIGVSTWGCDISGLFAMPEKPLSTGAGDRELWMRWVQLGALTPVMRTHLGFKPSPTPPLDLWHDEEMTAHFRRFAEFHVRLFPYLDTCARENVATGVPIMRAMLLQFPDDPVCWTLGDQYMLGPSLLVAPVLSRGARTRRVYVPAGEWLELGTAVVHAGPGWVTVDAPLDRVPILQRAGTMVPMLAETPETLAEPRFASGGYDVELLVAPVPGAGSEAVLGDGTRLSLAGASLTVDGPERTYVVKANGAFMGLARGTALDFELSPAVRLASAGVLDPAERSAALQSARADESAQGVHHDEAISPEPPRPGVATVVRARAAAGLGVAAGFVHYTTDGSSPEEASETRATVRMQPVAGGSWEASIPPQPEDAVLRYAIEMRDAQGAPLWAEDAGPGLEHPDPDVPFVRPAARVFRHVVQRPRVPSWIGEATVYHLLVDRFARDDGSAVAPPDGVRFLQFAGGTLRGITSRLDRLAALGVDCLLLSPITPGEMHVTYDVKDLVAVDPRFGTLDDVRTLLGEAHARGIRVLLDTETSYLGVRHPAAVSARTDPSSPHRSWFHWHHWPDRWYSWFSGRIFMGVDHTNPDARRALLDAARFWIDLGFDGYRLDSAAATPFEFWSEFGEVVRRANPDAVTLAEAFGDASFVRHYRGRLSGVLDFHVSHLLRQCFATCDEPLAALDAVMRTRATETAEEDGELVRAIFVENHDMPRFSRLAGEDDRRLLLALTALLTLGPPPILYYGSEVGLRQGARLGIDPDARLPMLWDSSQDAALLDRVRALVHLRRDLPALRRGVWRSLLASDHAMAYLRDAGGLDRAVVVLRRDGTAAGIDVPLGDVWADGTRVRDVLGVAADTVVRGSTTRITLPPWSAAVLVRSDQGAANAGR
ncbi:MAG TPA: TIM-barrel domain-containing protein [Candidatus Angelobacter sp.]|nr:TIM-barrel domain-containing protein [Candidatus Angelobacter sp.]